METKIIVIGTIGSDAHVVGVKLMTHALTKAGFNVICLGSLNSQEDFIRAAVEANAAAILVSSLYGMAMAVSDCRGFKEKCTEAGLKDVLLYIGGNLEAKNRDWESIEKTFKDLGFDRVYPPGTVPAIAIADLRKDLGLAFE